MHVNCTLMRIRRGTVQKHAEHHTLESLEAGLTASGTAICCLIHKYFTIYKVHTFLLKLLHNSLF